MNRREAIKRVSMMLGVAISSPIVVSILEGCNTKKELGWFPKFFDEDQAILVAELSETILPKTDTPGAKDIGVDAFIDHMVRRIYTQEEQQTFLDGLVEVNKMSEDIGNELFINLEKNQQNQVVEKLDQAVLEYDAYRSEEGQPFFSQLKELTLLGYFTSEEIIKNHLQYVPIPTKFEGCTEVGNNQKIMVGNHV